jgi:hypothetical protein
VTVFYLDFNHLTDILPGTTLQDVRLELAKADAVQAGQGKLPQHKVSPGGFLMIGFELEDSQ